MAPWEGCRGVQEGSGGMWRGTREGINRAEEGEGGVRGEDLINASAHLIPSPVRRMFPQYILECKYISSK